MKNVVYYTIMMEWIGIIMFKTLKNFYTNIGILQRESVSSNSFSVYFDEITSPTNYC